MTALFIGVLFVWVALMIVRLTLPRVRVSDGVLWLSYGVLVPGIVSTLVVIANVRSIEVIMGIDSGCADHRGSQRSNITKVLV